MDIIDPLKNIVFISIPENINNIENLPIDPAILLPVEIDPDNGYSDITNLSWEMIIAAALKILAHNPEHEYADYYRQLITVIKPDIKNELTNAAIVKAGEKEFDIAEELFLSLTNLFSSDFTSELNLSLLYDERADSYTAIGKIELAEEFNEKAFEAYKKLLSDHPDSEEAHFNFGLFFLKKSNFEKATEHLDFFIKNSTDEKKKKKVVDILEQINQKKKSNDYFLSAYDLIKMGKEDEAIIEIKKYIETAPKVWNAWFLLGWACRRKERYAEGAAAFERALELGSDQIDLYNELAICQMELGRLDESRENLLTALKREPDNIKILSNLGIVSLKNENTEAARQYFKNVLELDPDDKIASEYLARLG
ncbi:MAG: tetratricopeptide repeat protein [Spirochaetales bacterium]|nr:tetratricopeptide repeat protein [Spirochaetales bacterium]